MSYLDREGVKYLWSKINTLLIDKADCYECIEIERHIPTRGEIKQMLIDLVQLWMDETAKKRGYDNIHTATSYAQSTDPIFKKEGKACLGWRDKVWRTCYQLLDEVEAGQRPIPTGRELLLLLPQIEW